MVSKSVDFCLSEALKNTSPLLASRTENSGYMLYTKPCRSIIDTTDPSTEFFLVSSVLINEVQASQ